MSILEKSPHGCRAGLLKASLDVGLCGAGLGRNPSKDGDNNPENTPSSEETAVANGSTCEEREDEKNDGDNSGESQYDVEVQATLVKRTSA